MRHKVRHLLLLLQLLLPIVHKLYLVLRTLHIHSSLRLWLLRHNLGHVIVVLAHWDLSMVNGESDEVYLDLGL